MYSRAVAACSRLAFPSPAKLPAPIYPRRRIPAPAYSNASQYVRYLSTTPVPRAAAVLAHAPTKAELAAEEEFSEAELLPPEEAQLNITDAAAEQLRNISMRDHDEDVALRVLVESGGCHGYQYKMELTCKRQPSDYHFVRPPTTPGRVGVVVDPISLSLLKGSTIDFATELIGSSFRIKDNPQASGKGCGCGVSWELKE